MKYSDKLKDPRWQKKRLEIFERDGFCCVYCFDDSSMLSVHHLYYDKKNPWESDNDILVTLCESCHNMESDFSINRSFVKISSTEKLFHAIQKHLRISSESVEYLADVLLELNVDYPENGEDIPEILMKIGKKYKEYIQKNIQGAMNHG